jgi:hypothetical protein
MVNKGFDLTGNCGGNGAGEQLRPKAARGAKEEMCEALRQAVQSSV